jgi:hypothetical protein
MNRWWYFYSVIELVVVVGLESDLLTLKAGK